MTDRYDVIVIGGGLGGLTASALVAQAGRKTLLVERNHEVGGAASTYRVGDLVVEASLHETADPKEPLDPKHHVLARLGVLDAVEWVSTREIYEVRGGPIGAPFVLPCGFAQARRALVERFPQAASGISSLLGEIEHVTTVLGTLSRGRQAFRNPVKVFSVLTRFGPLVRGWRLSVAERFNRAFGANDEATKCALAANLAYYHDDPDTLWWMLFAVAQGGYLNSGGRYIRGGSQRLSRALADALTSAGGEILLGHAVTEILVDPAGRPSGIAYARKSGERIEAHAPVIICNAAPAVAARMLPRSARDRFWSRYAGRPLSISLFSVTFGLSARPAEFGFRSYSTILLPKWMTRLADYRRCGKLMAGMPGDVLPPLTIVDYSAIDSGLGGPPYPVAVVGVDRTANWSGIDSATYDAKRERWREAILSEIDDEFPGFTSKVGTSVFNTASTLNTYLNAPDGAIYGFAPRPPAGPIWRGPENSPNTPIRGLYLASAYAGSGGFTGAILAGAAAAKQVLLN